jgi:CheY-like chemotaxis protein
MHRILVVEDENWLAVELAWLVQEAGYAVLGPERSVAEALKVVRTLTVDLALLDVAMGGETVFPLSRMLEHLGVPFIFLTDNPTLLPAEYRARPLGAQAVAADGSVVADPPGAGEAAHRALVRVTVRSRECHGTSPRIVITARLCSGRGTCRSYGA